MEKEILKKYLQAGEIAAKALALGASMIKPGVKILEIAETLEKKIFELGAKPAFPVNISINEIAAHYTPTKNDPTTIKENDYVKLDVGVHVDGYIGDTALTIRPAGKDPLIECSEKMLERALPMFTPGTKLSEIGEAIEEVAIEFGFNPVRNLTGHGLDRYNLHAGAVVPNIKTHTNKIIQENEVYAVEPFATPGAGMIKDSSPTLIFRWLQDKPTRNPDARKILELAKHKFDRLPFAKRWLQIPQFKLELALRELLRLEALHPYSVLKEVKNAPVSQTEHTVIVKEKPIVTTRI